MVKDATRGPTATKQMVIALFDSVSATPNYEANRVEWDRVIELLDFKLNCQPAIAKVLGQDRWRTARNPKGYVARAAWIQAQSMRLLGPGYVDSDLQGKKLKVIRGERLEADKSHGMDLAVDENGDDRLTSHQERWDTAVHKITMKGVVFNGIPLSDRYDKVGPIIPRWLQRPNDGDAYNWETVARYAATKPCMVPALALALQLRFERSLPREQAISWGRVFGQNVEAAWKWIDRNGKDRIAPLLRMEQAPSTSPDVTKPGRPRWVPPGDAIKQACARHRGTLDLIPSPGLDPSRSRNFWLAEIWF